MFKHLKPALIVEVLIHVLFWVFITITPIMSGPYSAMPHPPFFDARHFILMNILLAIQFYLNAFLLIPVVLNKNKNIGLYFALLLLSFIILNLLMILIRPQFPMPPAMMMLTAPAPVWVQPLPACSSNRRQFRLPLPGRSV
jgi:two-component system LytT family sensor kinase